MKSRKPPPSDSVPHDVQAEKAALGSVIVNPALLPELDAIGDAEWWHPGHDKIAGALRRLGRKNVDPDVVSLAAELGESLPDVGGRAYLETLVDAVPVSSHVRHYIGIVKEAARDRQVLNRAVLLETAIQGRNGGGREEIEQAVVALRTALDESGVSESSLAPDSAATAQAAAAEPIRWVVEPLTLERGVRIVSGIGGARKTTLSMYLALLAVLGRSGAGLNARGGYSVAFLDAENGAASWWRKMYSVAGGLEIDLAELVPARIARYPFRRLYLDDDRTLRRTIETLRAAVVTEVVIDSLTAVHRLDENSSGQMRQFFDGAIFRIAEEVQCGVTVLHHSRKPPQGVDDVIHAMRGSSDLRNAVETHINIDRVNDLSRITVTKQRDAMEPKPIHLRIEDRSGCQMWSVAEAPPSVEREDAEARVLDAVRMIVQGDAERIVGVGDVRALLGISHRDHAGRKRIERCIKNLVKSGGLKIGPSDGTFTLNNL